MYFFRRSKEISEEKDNKYSRASEAQMEVEDELTATDSDLDRELEEVYEELTENSIDLGFYHIFGQEVEAAPYIEPAIPVYNPKKRKNLG